MPAALQMWSPGIYPRLLFQCTMQYISHHQVPKVIAKTISARVERSKQSHSSKDAITFFRAGKHPGPSVRSCWWIWRNSSNSLSTSQSDIILMLKSEEAKKPPCSQGGRRASYFLGEVGCRDWRCVQKHQPICSLRTVTVTNLNIQIQWVWLLITGRLHFLIWVKKVSALERNVFNLTPCCYCKKGASSHCDSC